MCYRCQVCSCVVPIRQPQLRILILRQLEVPVFKDRQVFDFQQMRDTTRRAQEGWATRTEIEKEIPACRICKEGHENGIPLSNLATMNRPQDRPNLQNIPRGAQRLVPTEPAGADFIAFEKSVVEAIARVYVIPQEVLGHPVTSPKERAAKVDKFLEAEASSRKGKKAPLKALVKRGKHANRQADKLQAKAKPGG